MTKIEQILEAEANYNKLVSELGKDAVAEQLQTLFAAYPELEAIRWTQYTPGFNDGDPCTFGMHEVMYQATGIEEDEDAEDEDYNDGFLEVPWDAKSPMFDAINEFEGSRNEDVMRKCFGDGVQITATREGVEVEEYDCGY